MARTPRVRWVGVALASALAAAAVVGSLAPAHATSPTARIAGGAGDEGAATVPHHGTRPVPLDAVAVGRVARAFGITAEPERIAIGWEAEEGPRELYLWRAPSAWYVQFTDGSALLGPPGDRSVVCALPDAPSACAEPGLDVVADAAAPPPGADEAASVARSVLRSTGLLQGRWEHFVMEPSRDALPCPDELDTPFACTRQTVPTRAVLLTRDLGPDAAAARWTVIVAPRGTVLSAVGRVAVARSASS